MNDRKMIASEKLLIIFLKTDVGTQTANKSFCLIKVTLWRQSLRPGVHLDLSEILIL